MSAVISLLLLLVFVLAIVGLRFFIERAIASHVAPRLRGTWLGLIVFVAICLSGAIGSAGIALAGLASGSVHCFGRRCGSLAFQFSSSPESYWLGIALWTALATFFVWVTVHGIRRFAHVRRSAS